LLRNLHLTTAYGGASPQGEAFDRKQKFLVPDLKNYIKHMAEKTERAKACSCKFYTVKNMMVKVENVCLKK